MKPIRISALIFLALLLLFSSCEKDDENDSIIKIEIEDVVLSEDNTSLMIGFNQMVYGNASLTEPLSDQDFELSISNFPEESFMYTVSHTPGEKNAQIDLTFSAYPDGDEIMEITSKANQIFGEQGNSLTENLINSVPLNAITPPLKIKITQVDLSTDNTFLTIRFNQHIYGNNNLTDSIGLNAFTINISDYPNDSLSYTFSHAPGEDMIEFQFDFLQPANGNQILEINFLAGKIFGETGQSPEQDLEVMVDVNRMTAQFEIIDFFFNQNNTRFSITLNDGIYSDNNMSGNLSESNFLIGFSDATTTFDYTVEHTAGQPNVSILFEYDNWENNDQILEVTFLPNHIYDAAGRPLVDSLRIISPVNEPGIIGNWSAYDISFILQSIGFDDSLYVNFMADQSYMITAHQGGIPIVFEGNYEMVKTEFDDIWEIELDQTSPASIVNEGIFKVFPAEPDSMWYEVVQVEPPISGVTPPTPEEGFGSTSGGAFGSGNIQKYFRIEPE